MPSGISRPAVSTPTLAQVSGFPADWLATSACVHIVAIIVLLLIPEIPIVREVPVRPREAQETPISLVKSKDPPLLASIQSSASGSRPAPSPKNAAPGHSLGSGSSSVMPVVFKGAQHIVSDTPDADNSVQTILQPDIENPPRLHAPIPVPSLVKIAAPQRPPSLSAPRLSADIHVAAPPVPAPAAAPPLPLQHAEINTVPLTSQTTLVDSPKLAVFATAGRSYTPPKQPPPPPSPPSPVASAPVVAAASPSPEAPAVTAKSNIGQDAHNLLVANAIDVQSNQSKELLAEVEIHGRFEVSSNPRLAGVGASSPSSAKTASGSGSGSGRGSGASRAKGSGSSAGAGTGTRGRAGNGAAEATGNAEGKDGVSGRSSSDGSGRGSSGNNGQGAGNGNGTGSAGTGNGNQPSPFMGMTITGGVHSGSGGMAVAGRRDLDQTKHGHGSYGMTIISTGASGGGLRDFGVFSDGPVYTVYVDVSSIGIQGTRWSLQYGPSREVRLAHPGVLLSPPFPETQKLPHLPPALVASNIGRLLVVQAVLTPDGALDSMRILQTPDERLNQPLIASLAHWTFQPASMGAEKVPVRILLGVPVAAIMATEPDAPPSADQAASRDSATRTSAQ